MKKNTVTGLLVLIFSALCLTIYIVSDSPFQTITPPSLSAATPKDLLTKLINNQEYFMGSTQIKYVNQEMTTVEITIVNNTTGDDSVIKTNQKFIAEKQNNNEWKITKLLQRWKCRSLFDFSGWTTKTCS